MVDIDERRPELTSAVQTGDLEEVQRLTSNLDRFSLSTWVNGFYMLCDAITRGRLEIAKLLINHGCVVKQGCQRGTVLHTAAIHGDLEIVKMLTEKYCSMADQNDSGLTVLHMFAQRRTVDEMSIRILVHLLVTKKGNVNIKNNPANYTPLHFAAECGNPEMISLLLKHGAQVNSKTASGRTALHIAASNGYTSAVRILLQHDKEVHLKDKMNKTPLCLAIENQDLPTIQVFMSSFLRTSNNRDSLVKNNPLLIYSAVETMNPSVVVQTLVVGKVLIDACSIETGKNPLHLAVEKESEDIVGMLLKHHADVNAKQKSVGSVGTTALHIAAKKDLLDISNLLLHCGAKPEAVDEKGKTALYLAAENGSLDVATSLLKKGYQISALFTPEKSKGYTPLHVAVENGYEDIVRMFLGKGISVELSTKTGLRPLHLAAYKGNATLVKILLKYGANPSSAGLTTVETPLFFAAHAGSSEIVEIFSEVSTNRKKEWLEGYVALYIASYHGHESVFQILLRKGVDPNSNFKNYLTPLHAAAQMGHKNIVNLLLEKGAVVNPSEKNGADKRFSTPIIAAVLNGHEEIVQMLLDHGADLNASLNSVVEVQSKAESLLTYGYSSSSDLVAKGLIRGYKLIHFAAESGNKSIIDMLLKRGHDVNLEAKNSETPLSIAVKREHVEIVAYLLENGANTNLKGLLFTAILTKNVGIVELLLKFNTPLNFTSSFGRAGGYTPLHMAVMKSNVAIVELLLKRGATVDVHTDQDFPLHCAVKRGKKDIISKLIEFGASIESQCGQGLSPLFHSVLNNDKDVFLLLLREGAFFDATTSRGQPLLHFALINKVDEGIIRLIVDYGVDVNQKNDNNVSPIELVIKGKYVDPDEEYDPAKEEKELKEKKGMDHDVLLKLLLKYGFDVNTQLKNNVETILHYACHTRNTYTVKQLLQYDADVNVLDDKEHTPFFYAVKGACDAMEEFYSARDFDYEKKKSWKNRDLEKSTFERYCIYGCYNIEKDGKLVENRDAYQALARSMTRVIAKIQASKGELHWENRALLNNEFVKRYYRRCQREITKLKEVKIIDNISYFNILIANDKKLANYARNEAIIQAMKSGDFKEDFPVYAEDLESRFERGMDRKNVLEMSVQFLNEVAKFRIPGPLVDEIFQYLNRIDLLNLCRAGHTLVCSCSDRY